MKKGIFLGMLVLLIAACGSSNAVVSKEGTHVLDAWVADQTFAVASEWARPQPTSGITAISNTGLLGPGNTLGRISLIGNPNYFRVQGDSISAYLPYYGERQVGGGYNSSKGVEFHGKPTDMTITKNPKDDSYQMCFTITEDSETYRVNARLFPNLSATISVFSSHRFVIRYDGKIQQLEGEMLVSSR